MKQLDNTNIGRITIVAGISSLIGTLTMIEFMVAGNTGLLTDHVSVITAILILPLLNAMGKIAMTKHKNIGRSVQILGVLGTLINFVGGIINVLALRGIIEYEHQASWIMVGGGLIGIAILTFMLLNRNNPELKKGYVWFSIVFGLGMAMSFLGLIFRDELNAIMRFEISIADSSPGLKLLLFFASPTVILGHPIWVLWSGRQLLKEKLSIEE